MVFRHGAVTGMSSPAILTVRYRERPVSPTGRDLSLERGHRSHRAAVGSKPGTERYEIIALKLPFAV
jgi:hypothetical protein